MSTSKADSTPSLTWEQKLSALQALCEVQLCMRKPGDWYVSADMEIKEGPILRGAYGEGRTPEEAVEDHWRIYTTEASFKTPIVVRSYIDAGDKRKYWVWAGFMWREIGCPAKTEAA